MFNRENSLVNSELWIISSDNTTVLEELFADVLMHLPANTEGFFVVPEKGSEGTLQATIITPGNEIVEGVIYLHTLISNCTLTGLRFVEKTETVDSVWRFEQCMVRSKDRASLSAAICDETKRVFDLQYCLYSHSRRVASQELSLEKFNVDGKTVVKAVVKDISEIKRIEEEMSLEKKKLDMVSSLAEEKMVEYHVNDGEKMGPVFLAKDKKDDVINPKDVHFEDRPEFFRKLKRLMHNGKQEYAEVRIKNADGVYEWNAVSARAINGQNDETISIIAKVTNIDKEKKEQLRLLEEAKTDPLTRVLNKTTFIEEVKKKVASLKADRFGALAIVDVDKFKRLNDSQGHLFGDSVLVALAEALKSDTHQGDIVGRFGGDEFITYYHNGKSVEELVDRIIAVREKFYSKINESLTDDIVITVSIGIAPIQGNERRFEEVFDKADRALYYVKETGKNNYCVYRDDLGFGYSGDNKEKLYSSEGFDSKSMAEDLTYYALELLENTTDPKAAVKLLLGRIGERMGFDRISILEKNSELLNATITYQWASRGFFELDTNIENIANESLFLELKKRISDEGIIEIEDISDIEEILPEFVGRCKERNIKSMEVWPFLYKSELSGCVAYISCHDKKALSNAQKSELLSVSRILRAHLEKEDAYNRIDLRVKHLVNYDEITGFHKEAMFKSRVKDYIKNLRPGSACAIVSLDFMKFNYFNECFGFKSGDRLLKNFASVSKIVPGIIYGCRGYADNFLFLIDASNEDEVSDILNQYSEEFYDRESYLYSGFNFEIVAGAYVVEDKDVEAEVAIDNASLAKKERKATKRPGLLMFDVNMKTQLLKENALINIIDEAIEDDEFVVYLQPKIDIESGELVGAEALARWRKPNGVLTPPDSFIPILEKNSRLLKLDLFIYESVIKLLQGWIKKGVRVVPVSVNLSRNDIMNPRIVTDMVRIAEKYEVPCKLINIEITESGFMEDQQLLIDVLEGFRSHGFSISIDDFGKGYSSLNMLTNIPADYIKLDKDFLKHSEERETKNLVHNVIKLITDSEMDVICEGVETKEQASFLVENGCRYAQGFFYSKPIPANSFESMYFGLQEDK